MLQPINPWLSAVRPFSLHSLIGFLHVVLLRHCQFHKMHHTFSCSCQSTRSGRLTVSMGNCSLQLGRSVATFQPGCPATIIYLICLHFSVAMLRPFTVKAFWGDFLIMNLGSQMAEIIVDKALPNQHTFHNHYTPLWLTLS